MSDESGPARIRPKILDPDYVPMPPPPRVCSPWFAMFAVVGIYALTFYLSTLFGGLLGSLLPIDPDQIEATEDFQRHGLIVGVTSLTAGTIGCFVVWIVLMYNGVSLGDIFGVWNPGLSSILRWSLVNVCPLTVVALISFDSPDASAAFTIKTASPLWPLLLARVVVSPLYEELLFRGLLFEGLRPTILGPKLTIGIAALAWAFIHFQYSLYPKLWIAAFGILLGFARHRSNSLVVPWILHGQYNAVYTFVVWSSAQQT